MNVKLLKENDFITTNWSGGITKQLFIFPEDSRYKERDFKIRISTAKVQNEESIFTKLEDVHRIILLLEGEMKLTFNKNTEVYLNRYDYCEFEGAWETVSKGKATDFNLMLREEYKGELDIIKNLKEGNLLLTGANETDMYFIYPDMGNIMLYTGGTGYAMNAGNMAVIQLECREETPLHVKAVDKSPSNIVLAHVWFKE